MPKLRRTVLQSKVARRIFLLFVLSSLLPVGALALAVYTKGSERLREESIRQLRHACKTKALDAFERLQFLDAEMRMARVNGALVLGGTTGHGPHTRTIPVAWIDASNPTHPVFESEQKPPELSEEQWAHLAADKPLVVTNGPEAERPATFLVRVRDPAEPRKGTIWARIGVDDLLEFDSLAHARRLAILDGAGRPMTASVVAPDPMVEPVGSRTRSESHGLFEWTESDHEYFGAYWSLFLKVEFASPSWTFVLSEPRESMEAPISDFEQALMLSIILSVAVILLVSIIQIRRTLGPVAVLSAATRKLAGHEYDHRVAVRGGDEFADLAESFNTMAARTGDHVRALKRVGSAQRAILSTLDAREIVEAFVERVPKLVQCRTAGVLRVRDETGRSDSYIPTATGEVKIRRDGHMARSMMRALGPDVDSIVVEAPYSDYLLLEEFASEQTDRLLLLPVHIDGRLDAVVVLGCDPAMKPTSEGIARVHHLAGQLAVALANSLLIEQLDALNWGTLSALARAIDAKSPWTMGHSDRVMRVTVRMAEEMGLPDDEIQILRRGALLHDIGKIGTPAAILEKTGRLTVEEFEVIQEHVTLGGRILEPIDAFADLLPVVLQHHERLDGSGYPLGLRGDAIHLHARIVAVADCFDAMRSERPYRRGLPVPKVLEILQGDAGTLLDEDAVAALVRVVKTDPDLVDDEPAAPFFHLDPQEILQ